MAYFPSNFFHITANKLQFRVFLIPWIKGNNCISCCAKKRDYSGSVPVKYTPKRALKKEEDETVSYLEKRDDGYGLNVERVDFSKNLRRGFSGVESKISDAYRTADINYGINLEVEEEIEGDFLSLNDDGFVDEPDKVAEDGSEKCSGVLSGHVRQDVEKMAIELLASRAFTALELKKKLQAKRFPLEIVDAVLADFQSRGLINDCLYAEAYSRSRWSSSSWGPRRIRQALFKKGVSEVDTENAIKLVFQNGEDQDSGMVMSKLSMDQLFAQVSKQWQRSHGASQETRKSRIVRWLQYRGFNWGVIKHVLKKLESESSP